MAEQSGTAHQRLHASWHAAHRSCWSCSIAPRRHVHSCTRRASRAVSSLDGGCARRCAAGAPTLTKVVHRWQSSRARPTSACTPARTRRTSRRRHVASRCRTQLLRYGTAIESHEQLVNGGARRCAVEACTLAVVLHRWQHSRARPSSGSTPAGTQCITRPAHLASRCSRIED